MAIFRQSRHTADTEEAPGNGKQGFLIEFEEEIEAPTYKQIELAAALRVEELSEQHETRFTIWGYKNPHE